MNITLHIPHNIYLKLQKHLLPKEQTDEESAFVFAKIVSKDGNMELHYVDWYAVQSEDYESRSAYHFELTHETSGKIIKGAHDLDSCIVEFHSHIEQEFIRFSPTDWFGFSEFVPHVLWRLKGKPYVAIVITTQGIDALVWTEKEKRPESLFMLQTELIKISPTNNSLRYPYGKR